MFASPALLKRVGEFGKQKGVNLPSLKRYISDGAPDVERAAEVLSVPLPKGPRATSPTVDPVLAFGRWLVDRGLVRGDLADYQWESVDVLAELFFNDRDKSDVGSLHASRAPSARDPEGAVSWDLTGGMLKAIRAMASFADGVFDEVTADLGAEETAALSRLLHGEGTPDSEGRGDR